MGFQLGSMVFVSTVSVCVCGVFRGLCGKSMGLRKSIIRSLTHKPLYEFYSTFTVDDLPVFTKGGCLDSLVI